MSTHKDETAITMSAPRRLLLSRRQFVQLTGLSGAGLVVGFATVSCAPAASPASASAAASVAASAPASEPARPAARSATKDIDAWLHINEDGSIRLFTGKVEYGQGIQTGFGQLVAEELDVPFDRVAVTMGITNQVPWDSGTSGSQSMRSVGIMIRQASAEMRQWLLELGSKRLGLPVEQLVTRGGAVAPKDGSGASATYAELAAGLKIGRQISNDAVLKNPSLYTIVGQSIPRVDVPSKVNGAAKYGYDMRIDGMVYGRMVRPPSWGAKLKSIDFGEAQKMPGVVEVFHDGDFAGLAAQRPEQAAAALAAVKADWDELPAKYTSENIFGALKTTKDQGTILKETGDVATAMSGAVKKLNLTIRAPYVSHAQMEPNAALANVQADKTEIWTCTQSPFTAQESVAQALNMSPDKVVVYPQLSGGAFGRKTLVESAVEAARLSKAFNRPVRINWTRPEEFQLDHFRPAMLIELTAGLDGAGQLVAWQYDVYATAYYPEGASKPTPSSAQTGGNVLDLYSVPNARSMFYQSVAPLPPHYWRANGAPVNAFAIEAMLNMLAEAAGTDPVSFRTKLLQNNPRLAAVMRAAVQKAGWTPGLGSTGQGFGLGLSFTDGTYVAEVAQVAVDKSTGKVTVKHIDAAVDCGLVVNPAAVRAQVEGSIVMHGTSSTMKEQIHFNGGRVVESSYAQYGMLTSSEAPTVDVVFVEDKKQPMQGIGEPAVAASTAAIANAIYDAIGARVWDLPFTPDKVLAALGSKAS